MSFSTHIYCFVTSNVKSSILNCPDFFRARLCRFCHLQQCRPAPVQTASYTELGPYLPTPVSPEDLARITRHCCMTLLPAAQFAVGTSLNLAAASSSSASSTSPLSAADDGASVHSPSAAAAVLRLLLLGDEPTVVVAEAAVMQQWTRIRYALADWKMQSISHTHARNQNQVQ